MTAARNTMLVFFGGVAGVSLRWSLIQVFPVSGPWAVYLINVLGSFLLGCLYGYSESYTCSWLTTTEGRLLFGTGLLGGFTTYSTFAVDVVQMSEIGSIAGIIFAGSQLILGACAALCGLWLGNREKSI
ncbi:fluoride efflux transporter FluC [Arcanobacterium buesumense]|uniref:Fluoride-specific ion channel FluC n=1 Tax=Arcanobacterium buesumense TaxID=2722751 RepID=A0A6H2ELH7_9ACTO|nr:CrcB family protein [Arcanobacterium buesumense]QJC21928.1 CrcB family protein [Arcanobacterium buesumense]